MAGDIATGPNSLVGESVVVELVRPGRAPSKEIGNTGPFPLEGASLTGRLDNVGEYGIVATLEDMGQRFYPWSSVLSLSRPE